MVTRFRPPQTDLARIYYYFLFSVVLLGPFATLGSLLAWSILFSAQPSAKKHHYDQTEKNVDFSEIDKVRFQLTENLWAENESGQVAAFVDIMKGEDRSLKQNAIDKVVQHPSHLSIEILREGLQDDDPDIRYYAASGLIQLNDLFQKELSQLRYQTEQTPQNPIPWYQLGVTYEHYCFWGLASADSLDDNLDQAEACLQQCLAVDPQYEEAYTTLGRLLTKRKKVHQSLDILQKGLAYFPRSVDLIGWYGEALYEAKQFVALEKFAQQSVINVELPENLRKPFLHWAYTPSILTEQDRSFVKD